MIITRFGIILDGNLYTSEGEILSVLSYKMNIPLTHNHYGWYHLRKVNEEDYIIFQFIVEE